jgi:hypothetical protein
LINELEEKRLIAKTHFSIAYKQLQYLHFRKSPRPRYRVKNYETYVEMTGIELSNYGNWNQFNQSYRERVVIDLVQTCSVTNSAEI